MENKTLGIIYALKLGSYTSDMNIRKFMSEWSQSNWNYQGREQIDDLLNSLDKAVDEIYEGDFDKNLDSCRNCSYKDLCNVVLCCICSRFTKT